MKLNDGKKKWVGMMKKHPVWMARYVAERIGLTHMKDEDYLKLVYEYTFGRPLDLDNPKSFNEKLQWLKLYDRNPIYTTMVDKFAVKKYVADIIGEEYIIPTYGVWERFDEIDFDMLPNRFVLKCTHDSGGIVIVKDKALFDKNAAREKINNCLNRNYYYVGREWPYKDVKPRIIAEQYLDNKDERIHTKCGMPKKSGDNYIERDFYNKKWTDDSQNKRCAELMDYKVLCFEGEPKLIEVHSGRNTKKHTQDFYDTNWKKMNIEQIVDRNSLYSIAKPLLMDRILMLSEKLAFSMHHVRVDWYIVDSRAFFGELTLYDSSGFCPFTEMETDITIGSWINIGGISRQGGQTL